MYDQFNRRINYLRISVTDRCNLRCVYCMPAEGVSQMHHNDILSYDEIFEFTKYAVANGVNKVRVTGGEPLVRKGVIDLVGMLGSLNGIEDLSMTTNGILLDRFADQLVDAGLMRVNVSLDTIDPVKYTQITRGGDINKVFAGLKAAQAAGLTPIKINCVINESALEPDAQAVQSFSDKNGYEIRFIHMMDLEKGYFKPVEGGEGGKCEVCNRLRLTSNGYVKPCLFSTKGYSVRELGIEKALKMALDRKPACGGINHEGQFYNIGG